jgi:hypothetical protein
MSITSNSTRTALFERVCEMDLEGIVARRGLAPNTAETKWYKIKNRNYSQMVGCEELFERERHREPVAGWHSCDLACAEAAGTARLNSLMVMLVRPAKTAVPKCADCGSAICSACRSE